MPLEQGIQPIDIRIHVRHDLVQSTGELRLLAAQTVLLPAQDLFVAVSPVDGQPIGRGRRRSRAKASAINAKSSQRHRSAALATMPSRVRGEQELMLVVSDDEALTFAHDNDLAPLENASVMVA